MRIVTISDNPNLFSGLARVHRHVIDGFVEDGHEVIPCVWHGYTIDEENEIREATKEGRTPDVRPVYYESGDQQVRLLCLPKAGGNKEMFALFEIVSTMKPDVVFTIGDHWRFFYMQAIKMKLGFSFKWIPYLTVEHDVEDSWRQLMTYADAVVTPSEFGAKAMSEVYPKDVEVVPYGTEESFVRYNDRRRRTLRRARGCSGKVRFITVAQNTWRKNLPALIQAVSIVSHRDPGRKMQFYVHTNVDAGDDETYLYDLKELVRRFNVSDWFVFPDEERVVSVMEAPGDDLMVDEYNCADFFILPSTFEGYGLPLVEAMACGVVPIAHSSSTIPEHLGGDLGAHGDGDRGFLVGGRTEVCPPSKLVKVVRPDALGQSIWEAYVMTKSKGGRETLSKMSQRCQSYGKEKSWETMKRELCNLVRRSSKGSTILPVEEL